MSQRDRPWQGLLPGSNRAHRHQTFICSVDRMLDVFDSYRLDPLRTPGRGIEWVSKVLSFMRHFSISKLHNAHGVDALAFVVNHILSDPKIARSCDAADRKA